MGMPEPTCIYSTSATASCNTRMCDHFLVQLLSCRLSHVFVLLFRREGSRRRIAVPTKELMCSELHVICGLRLQRSPVMHTVETNNCIL